MKAYRPTPGGSLKKLGGNLGLSRRTEGFWALPTISRPANVSRLIESYREVGECAPVVVFIWKSDPRFSEVMNQAWPEEWTVLVEDERFTAAAAMRRAVRYAPKAAFYGFLADDVVFKTRWAEQLASAAVPCFVAYPDDGLQHEALCTHFVVGGELVRHLGYWALPGLQHSGLDLVWMALGQNVPGLLKYRPDVQWEHLHPIVNKAEIDEIYEFAKKLKQKDDAAWKDWINGEKFARDIKLTQELLYG